MKKNDLLLFSLMMKEAAEHEDVGNCKVIMSKAMTFLSSKISSDIFPINDLAAPFVAFLLGEYKDAIEKSLDESGKKVVKDLQSGFKKSLFMFSDKPPHDMEDKQ